MDISSADTMADGWKLWLEWHRAVAPDNATEIKAVEMDAGSIWATFASLAVVGVRRNWKNIAGPTPCVPSPRSTRKSQCTVARTNEQQ
jgi:hypothetical protein